MQSLENLLKALADKNRLRILKLLKERKMCVCELAFVLGITQPSVSRHLKKLCSSGITAHEQDGLWTNYYLRQDNEVLKMLLSCFKKQLNDNAFKSDLMKLKRANRALICCRK